MVGPLSVAVPGEVAGYWAAHQKYGRLPWDRLVLPSVYLASDGLPVNWHLANALKQTAAGIVADSSMWDFLDRNTGQVLTAGDIVKRPLLAETLRSIAINGADVFYNGTIGDQLVGDIQKRGGIITKQDLVDYRPQWVDPVQVQLSNNLTLYSMPPPGSGVLVAYILNILDEYLVQTKDKSTGKSISQDPLTYHRMAEAFKHAYAQRTKLGDPCCNATAIDEIQQVILF